MNGLKLLGIESSARAASAAVWEDGRLLCEGYVDAGLTHSETLLPVVDAMLRAAALTPDDVDSLAVAAGPGSFTGLRIGIAAVKGMAFARSLPCVPVSTLEALAYNLLGRDCVACAVMDARCKQVYTACFLVGEESVERLTPDEAITIVQLGESLAALHADKPIVFVGDGAHLCMEALGAATGARMAPPHLRLQHAAGVCMAASRRMAEALPPEALEPAYLRLPQAERELLKKEGKQA